MGKKVRWNFPLILTSDIFKNVTFKGTLLKAWSKIYKNKTKQKFNKRAQVWGITLIVNICMGRGGCWCTVAITRAWSKPDGMGNKAFFASETADKQDSKLNLCNLVCCVVLKGQSFHRAENEIGLQWQLIKTIVRSFCQVLIPPACSSQEGGSRGLNAPSRLTGTCNALPRQRGYRQKAARHGVTTSPLDTCHGWWLGKRERNVLSKPHPVGTQIRKLASAPPYACTCSSEPVGSVCLVWETGCGWPSHCRYLGTRLLLGY